MKTFKEFTEQDYIDWNYVFGFILEEEDEPSFKVERDDFGEETHTHTFKVPKESGRGNHTVNVKIGRQKYKNGQIAHHVSFDVDGSVEAARARRMSGQQRITPGPQRMKILGGVSRAITSYATKNVGPGHSIVAGSGDPNSGDDERKARVQGEFFKGLARHLGRHLGTEAEYHNYGGSIHEIRIPKRRKAAKTARISVEKMYGTR